MIGELKKLLLVLPSNTYRAQRFIQAAAKLDIELSIATDGDFSPPDPIGTIISNVGFCDAREAGQQLADIARHRGIDSALAVDESGIEVAAWANAFLRNEITNLDGILATRNKAQLRQILREAGVPQPAFAEVVSDADPTQNEQWVGYPAVVKPTKGSGSLGVTLARDIAELREGQLIAQGVMEKMGFVGYPTLVEEYIDGAEYAVEVLVVAGVAKILAIFEKPDPLVGPTFAETIYLTPARISKSTSEAMASSVAAVANALGIRTGPMHIEMRISAEGVCFPIDVASRSIGGKCSDALSFSFATTLEELILANAASGVIPDVDREHQSSGVFMIPVEAQGVLRAVSGIASAMQVPFVQGVEITLPLGTPVVPLPWDNQYLGFIFAKAPGPAAVEKALREARSRLEIIIARDCAIES